MALSIFHTADVHLGMKFAGYPEVQVALSEARFETLGRLVQEANEERCELFVIAGDLFDRVSVSRVDILKGVNLLKDFQGKLVAVLPGNHDYCSEVQSEPWATFRDQAGDTGNILLLDKPAAYPLTHHDIDAVLYPAPCESKHSVKNALAWINEAPRDPQAAYHIGVAHGSLRGFSPDFDEHYYPMTVQELLACRLDLWLLGHTHAWYPEHPGPGQNIFYPGTPEPDGFDCRHEGHAWIIRLDEDGSIHPQSFTTGKYRFIHDEAQLSSEHDLEKLRARYAAVEYKKTLLKLTMRGRLPRELYGKIPAVEQAVEENLLYLHQPVDKSALMEEITARDIDREFTLHSFPHRLLTSLAGEEDNEALQIAYEMIQELKR